MRASLLIVSGLIVAAFSINSVVAQLSTRGGQLKKRYDEERTKGITLLNQRYIASLKKELSVALREKRLEEANKIQAHVKRLEAEIEMLSKQDVELTSVQTKANSETYIVGKSIGFPWDRDPSQQAYFSFQKKGKALWLGTKNQAVPRSYRHTGKLRQYLIWWSPENEERGDYQITIGPEGKTAEMLEVLTGKITAGVVERTR